MGEFYPPLLLFHLCIFFCGFAPSNFLLSLFFQVGPQGGGSTFLYSHPLF